MILCNGVAFKDIPLQMYTYKDNNYYDNVCAFDIEVSTAFKVGDDIIGYNAAMPPSFYSDLPTQSLLYLWSFCIDGYLFTGRSTDDLLSFFTDVDSLLDGTLYIYVHNLGYEFQFLRNLSKYWDVFARKTRKPMKCRWRHLEFRCSYLLTQLSLDAWGREKNLEVKKLTGVYDYSLLRTPLSVIDVVERDYSYYDVATVVAGINEYKARYGHVKDIPLTQTSCIRKEVNKVMKNDLKTKKAVSSMTDVSLELYMFMIACFMGGYTHANIIYANRVLDDMLDFDHASSYPWCMLSEKYPISKFRQDIDYEYYMSHEDRYCYLMHVALYDVNSAYFNTYISASKCTVLRDCVLDNGRVISASYLEIKVTDVDWHIIKKAYNIKDGNYKVLDFYYALKSYLPDDFRRYILKLYGNKTSLKNIQEVIDLYRKSKEEINGCYGMFVTRDITDEIVFNNGNWDKIFLSDKSYVTKKDKKLEKFYKLNFAYAQGIYVPAYGRKNLWSVVFELDDLIAYMDTDSYKFKRDDAVLPAIDRYNNAVRAKYKTLADDLGVQEDMFYPEDMKGISHGIGLIERDDDIKRFKTLGAKRYICEYDKPYPDNLKMTVSGVRKKAVLQLSTIDDFKVDTVFDIDSAEKLFLQYNDNQDEWVWKKGQFDEWTCKDRYGISSYNVPYHMKVKGDYLDIISQVLDDKTKIFRGL